MFLIKSKNEEKKVINPDTLRKLHKDGVVVHKVSTYWKRRKEDGDVIIEDMKKTSKKPAPKKEEGDK